MAQKRSGPCSRVLSPTSQPLSHQQQHPRLPLSPAAHAASMQAGGSSSTAEPAAVHSNAELLKELERKMEELNEIKKMLAKGETQPAPAAHAGANTGVAPSTPKAEAQARSQQPPVTPAAEPPAVTASAQLVAASTFGYSSTTLTLLAPSRI